MSDSYHAHRQDSAVLSQDEAPEHFLQSEISGVVNYTGLLKKYSPM